MKVLVTLYPEDAKGNKFLDCRDCAMARAVCRLLKPNYTVSEGGWELDIWHKTKTNRYVVKHKDFVASDFYKLKNLSKGSFMVYEMDIPKEYLKDEITANVKKETKNDNTTAARESEKLHIHA